jgi:hypothetical protein
LADHLDSVKSLIPLFRSWANRANREGRDGDEALHARRLSALEAVVAELEELRRITLPIPASYGDLSDLPPELLKELSGTKVDDREQQLHTIIKSGGDEVELDAILIELYRRFKVIETRKFLQNKLWRMAQKGIIYTVPGKKGVYAATKPKPVPSSALPSAFDDLDDDVPF